MAGSKINWQEIVDKCGESLEDMYKRLRSTRKVAKYIGEKSGIKITFNPILVELDRLGVKKFKGGANNIGPQKRKLGNKCIDCGKDRGINCFYCDSCHKKISKQVNCDMVF